MQRYTVYLFLENCSHVSCGISTHHQEHIQLYLQYLVLVKPLLLPATDFMICQVFKIFKRCLNIWIYKTLEAIESRHYCGTGLSVVWELCIVLVWLLT